MAFKKPKAKPRVSLKSKLRKQSQAARARKLRRRGFVSSSSGALSEGREKLGSDWDVDPRLLRYLEDLDKGPESTLVEQLTSDGIELPSPDNLDDEEVSEKLWEVIHGMAKRRHFLCRTDHLSDRELYRELWEKILPDPADDIDPEVTLGACYIDLVNSSGEDSEHIFLRYYADEFERTYWDGCLDGPIPPKEELCQDRDRMLPRDSPYFG